LLVQIKNYLHLEYLFQNVTKMINLYVIELALDSMCDLPYYYIIQPSSTIWKSINQNCISIIIKLSCTTWSFMIAPINRQNNNWNNLKLTSKRKTNCILKADWLAIRWKIKKCPKLSIKSGQMMWFHSAKRNSIY